MTPVFNGSASLRDAAGQMIENVAKSTRRKQTVDDAYIETLYSDVAALYHLDEGQGTLSDGKKADLGPLPTTSVILLATLAAVWVLILLYVVWKAVKKK